LANFKLAISDKKGKSITKELKDTEANPLLGLQVGSDVDASIVGMSGKIRITGGSDKSGVPMRADVHGMARKYVLLSKGVGFQENEKGLRKRKLIRGNIISDEIFQINFKFDGEIKDDPKEEPKKEAPKEEPKKEAPKEEPKKEAPKEEPKKNT